MRLPICCGLVPAGLTLTSCCLHWLSSTGSRLSWFVLEHWLSRGLAAVGGFGPHPLLEVVARRPQAACTHPGLDPMDFYFIHAVTTCWPRLVPTDWPQLCLLLAVPSPGQLDSVVPSVCVKYALGCVCVFPHEFFRCRAAGLRARVGEHLPDVYIVWRPPGASLSD